MDRIQNEAKLSKQYMLAVDSKSGLVDLTQDNVARVEAMILNDSAYLKSSNKQAIPTKDYGGSTAYWINKLKPLLFDIKAKKNKEYRESLKGAIEAIDRENSTHLNSDGVGRKEICDRLYECEKEWLIKELKNPDKEFPLIKLISEKTHPISSKHTSRCNLSFASKFCHFMCFYIFEGTQAQDNYSIYDKVLKESLPLYIEHYGLNKKDYKLDDYLNYRNAVDDILKKSGNKISRNGFDHLLWYYHKGRQ